VLRSGNREDIDTEKTEPPITAAKTETKEMPAFKKPATLLQDHIKVTSIKDTLEKNKPTTLEDTTKTDNNNVEVQKPATEQTQTIEPVVETHSDAEIITDTSSTNQEDTVYVSLQQCWEEVIKESSTVNTSIAEGLLSKQIPVANDEHIIEIEVPNQIGEREVKEIIPALTRCLTQKTGIQYSFDIKIVKTVQEKQVDKNNPDEKFIHLCKENPKLMEFKQRLNLSIS